MSGKYRLGIIIFALLLTACSEKTIPLSMNSSGYLPQVNRIISAAPSITEIIIGLELAGNLIAVDKYSLNIEGVRKELPEIDFFYPDIEAIANLKPDIIISGEINTNGNTGTQFDFFQRLGITVVQIQTSNSIEDIYRDILTIADALGVSEKGNAMAARMRMRINAVDAGVQAGRKDKNLDQSIQNVYFEIEPAPNMVSFGQGTYLNELIGIAGARNIFASEKRWFTPSAEAIISANPDIIFILGGISSIDEIRNRPGFQSINAVKQNKIFILDADRASRPSQNIVQTLEEMYRAIWQR